MPWLPLSVGKSHNRDAFHGTTQGEKAKHHGRQDLRQRLFRLVLLNPAVLCTSLLPHSFLETTEVAS